MDTFSSVWLFVWSLLITVDCTYADDVFLVLYTMAYLHTSPFLLFMFLASGRVNMPVYAVWAGRVMYQCWNRELVVHASVHYQRNRTNPNTFSSRLLPNLDAQPIVGRQKDNVLAHNSAVRMRCLCVQWRAYIWLRLTNNRVCFILPNDSWPNTSDSFPSSCFSTLVC